MSIGLAASFGRVSSPVMAVALRPLLVFAVAAILMFAVLSTKKTPAPEQAIAIKKSETPTVQKPAGSIQTGIPAKILPAKILPAKILPAKIFTEKIPPSRNVGGSLVAPLVEDEESEPLERVAARAQPTLPPMIKPLNGKRIKNYTRWRIVYNSIITSAGIFEAGESELVLPGIRVIATNEKCTLPGGVSWPCGMLARTALRSFINGKALTCKLPDIPAERSFEADCRLRGRDLGLWLVTNGWARAKPDGPYTNEQASAEQNRRGVFGNPPQGITINAP
jgi:hypothetical protein